MEAQFTLTSGPSALGLRECRRVDQSLLPRVDVHRPELDGGEIAVELDPQRPVVFVRPELCAEVG